MSRHPLIENSLEKYPQLAGSTNLHIDIDIPTIMKLNVFLLATMVF